MPKIVVESGMVLNMGGFILERKANLPTVDVIVGNPLKEDVKVPAPVYSASQLDEYRKIGLIVEYMQEDESLSEALERVKNKVKEQMR
ncbi:MAG: energy-converting hydrogenase B subunit EhbP [Candidatus Altiarchaeota archaeon]|nr:energy-converting hydrogenase B subunit EhbP [Candidatus Altiarchaeota archaeon]